MRRWLSLLVAIALLLSAVPALAQGDGDPAALPDSALLTGFRHEYQGWNNCGPATLAMGLSYFGWTGDQFTAASWLKPDGDDKNVSAWQMVEYTNSFTPVNALVRYAPSPDMLRLLLANHFPVIIAAGYQPEGYEWMGHYLLLAGYDRVAGTFTTQDSFLGPDTVYDEDELDTFWRHFNRVFIVLYPDERAAELMTLLGDHADEQTNAALALEVARQEAVADQTDPFAWFNMGTNYVLRGMYQEAAVVFDEARNAGPGLPWRMLWYQFGPFAAYYAVGRYDDVIDLAQYNLATTPDGDHPVEETYYYAGLAREALGETDRALVNYQQALIINPNFTPAREALDALQQPTMSEAEGG